MSSDAVRQIMEAIASTSDSEKTFIERIRDEGIAEGKAEDLLSVLDARGLAVTDEQRQKVTSSTDLRQLNLWFNRALSAATAAEVFAD